MATACWLAAVHRFRCFSSAHNFPSSIHFFFIIFVVVVVGAFLGRVCISRGDICISPHGELVSREYQHPKRPQDQTMLVSQVLSLSLSIFFIQYAMLCVCVCWALYTSMYIHTFMSLHSLLFTAFSITSTSTSISLQRHAVHSCARTKCI